MSVLRVESQPLNVRPSSLFLIMTEALKSVSIILSAKRTFLLYIPYFLHFHFFSFLRLLLWYDRYYNWTIRNEVERVGHENSFHRENLQHF